MSYDAAVFNDLKVCTLWDGWESIANYMIVRGEIPVGQRVKRRLAHTSRAPQAIAEIEQLASTWPTFRKRKPVEQIASPNDVARFVHPFTDDLGFSTQLVALADAICGPGGWRTGRTSARPEDVLVKTRRGKPLAMIAAARRNDFWMAL